MVPCRACRPGSRARGSRGRSTAGHPRRLVAVDPEDAPRGGIERDDVVGGWTVYMIPFTTSGVVSNFSSERAWNVHCSSSVLTFAGVI